MKKLQQKRNKANELKNMVGLGLSKKECEEFVSEVIQQERERTINILKEFQESEVVKGKIVEEKNPNYNVAKCDTFIGLEDIIKAINQEEL